MSWAYWNCYNLTGNPACGPLVTNMANTYYNCFNLTGEPVCGDKVTNMYHTYSHCSNLTGSPVCGPNVTDMDYAYADCHNLTGSPACSDKSTDLFYTYINCYNLTGAPVCGDNVIHMGNAYYDCRNLTGPLVAGPNVINFCQTYYNCRNIGSNGYIYSSRINNAYECLYNKDISRRLNIYMPDTGYNSTHNTLSRFLATGHGTTIVKGSITWTNDTINGCYYNTAYNIYIYPVDDVGLLYAKYELPIAIYTTTNTSMRPRTTSLANGIASEVIGNQVTIYPNSKYDVATYVSFNDSKEITSIYKIGNAIENMDNAFCSCYNLTGSPVCGPNVINMSNAYYCCNKLNGEPVCGPNVTDMSYTYQQCWNITGNPVCGDNVTNMYCAYSYCYNITGSPVCGDNVTTMYSTYQNCVNLTGEPVCGPNVTNMVYTYLNCPNLYGDMNIYSDNVSNATNCFTNRNTSNRLRIFVNSNSISCNTFMNGAIVGSNITWTDDMAANGYYYNTTYNIHLYPVSNVRNHNTRPDVWDNPTSI